MSYSTKVYRKPGGNELIVANGGVITVETGGSIDVDGDVFTAFDVDDATLEAADGTLQVKEGGLALVHLDSEVTDLLDIVAAIPTEDQKDGVSIWNNKGALEVSSSGS